MTKSAKMHGGYARVYVPDSFWLAVAAADRSAVLEH